MQRLLLAAVCVFALACSDSTGPESVLGTYSLRTVNGQPLPWVYDRFAYDQSEIVSEWIRLDGGGHAFQSLTEHSLSRGTITMTFSYKWSISGSTIVFTDSLSGSDTPATISGGTITHTAEMTTTKGDGTITTTSNVYVYKKE